MLTQEDAMEVLALKRTGLSNRHIGRKLGLDRRTVKRYLDDPSVIGHRKESERPSVVDSFKGQIRAWLDDDQWVTARWMHARLLPLGYTGSYERVKIFARSLKEERSRVAYTRFETLPGEQAQVDFAEFMVDRPDGSIRRYYLFIIVLGYSRMLYAELLERCDQMSFLDAHIRAFDFFGGVPREVLYDRMKNVYIRRVAGKHQFNASLVSMALHYGFTPRVAPAYAPWVKGKVERPITFVRENFWRGYAFSSLERANVDLGAWSQQAAQRVHGTTQQRVCERFLQEKPTLGKEPSLSFDTSYALFRKVYKDCTFSFDGNRYVAPPALVGKQVVVRVKDGAMRLFDDQRHVADYAVVQGRGHLSDPHGFYGQLRTDREMNRRKFSTGTKRGKGHAATISPTVPTYATVSVEQRMVQAYSLIGGEVAYG